MQAFLGAVAVGWHFGLKELRVLDVPEEVEVLTVLDHVDLRIVSLSERAGRLAGVGVGVGGGNFAVGVILNAVEDGGAVVDGALRVTLLRVRGLHVGNRHLGNGNVFRGKLVTRAEKLERIGFRADACGAVRGGNAVAQVKLCAGASGEQRGGDGKLHHVGVDRLAAVGYRAAGGVVVLEVTVRVGRSDEELHPVVQIDAEGGGGVEIGGPALVIGKAVQLRVLDHRRRDVGLRAVVADANHGGGLHFDQEHAGAVVLALGDHTVHGGGVAVRDGNHGIGGRCRRCKRGEADDELEHDQSKCEKFLVHRRISFQNRFFEVDPFP